ncbi:MAG: PAS domain S-box protein [Deltaproteobacteria bacterium]|nr:MAG: PAS domain S-box protein [Deltaproteobacteria bacterium]
MSEKKRYLSILFGLFVLIGLHITSLYSFLLFHSLAEIFSIVVASGIFMLAWNSRHLLDNNYLLFIGIAYLFIGGLDLVHTLAYKGMGVFHGYNANLPTQLWIAARYMESLSLLCASFFVGRRLRKNMVFLGYALAAALLLGSIFHWKLFPACFVEGVGLTSFKRFSEYMISLILIASIVMLWKKRPEFDADVLRLIIASILLTVASELAFTFYIHVYGFSNLVGHYLKIISYYLIYRAIIETGLARPYTLLFRNLKKSEMALRESEERYRRLVELSFDAIVIHARGQIVFVNSSAAELLGATKPEQLIGKSILDLVHPDRRAAVSDRVRQVLEEGKPVPPVEEKLVRLDRMPIDVEVLGIPILYQDQPAVQVVFRDITERKKTEAQIIRAKREWEFTFDAVPDLIMILDREHRILRANKAMGERLGVRLEELVGLNCYQVVHGTKEPPGFCPHKQLLADGLEHSVEVSEDRMGGDFLVSVSPLIEPDEPLKGSVHVARDITKRKKAEEALRASEQFSRSTLNSLSAHIAILDNEGEIIEVNDAWHQFARENGMAASLVGVNYLSVCDNAMGQCSEEAPLASAGIRSVIGGEQGSFSLEYPCHSPDEKRWFHMRVSRFAGPPPVRVVVAHEDITEQKLAEQALQRAHDGLERRVKERTAELGRVSARLLSVQEDERKRIARELHDSVGQSLAAMKFKLENTLDQMRRDEPRASIESLETLVPLFQQLSDEVRRIHTDLRPSLLDDLGIVLTISWFCREFESLYSDIRIEKAIHIEEKEVPDRFKIVIFRVLQEALNNVAKHSKAKLAHVSLRGKNGNIELLIKDEGQGFDVEEQRSEKSLSAGFGLTNMKERTELSGGSFWVESSKDRGTTIRALWPVKEEIP